MNLFVHIFMYLLFYVDLYPGTQVLASVRQSQFLHHGVRTLAPPSPFPCFVCACFLPTTLPAIRNVRTIPPKCRCSFCLWACRTRTINRTHTLSYMYTCIHTTTHFIHIQVSSFMYLWRYVLTRCLHWLNYHRPIKRWTDPFKDIHAFLLESNIQRR